MHGSAQRFGTPPDEEDNRSALQLDPAECTGLLAQLGEVLLSAPDAEEALQCLVELAADTIPGSLGAGVTLVCGQRRRTVAATDLIVCQADALQYRFNAGPCLTAWRTRTVVRIDDVAAETRWPQWCSHAADLGLTAVLSAPLFGDQEPIGAIKIYSAAGAPFDDRAGVLLDLFADHAQLLTRLAVRHR